MAQQAEEAFARTLLSTISTQPIIYSDDYQQPPGNSLKRVPVLQLEVPPPPQRKEINALSAAAISVVFKSTKPAASFTLSVDPADTISSIKSQLASQPKAPPADAQRLLLKGKALADGKLLREYAVKDGDVVNLMIKPGYQWDATGSTATASTTAESSSAMQTTLSPSPSLSSQPPSKKHTRIPSVVLSPSPSSESLRDSKPADITLTLDATIPPSVATETLTPYHNVISNPEFWERLYSFLRSEFVHDQDALHVFEDFLRAGKGALTASEIAKIRDHVGVIGMAGT